MGALDNGPLIIPITQMRQMLADCYWWRRIVDEDNPWDDETALAHTHIDAVDSPQDRDEYTDAELVALRPFAIVYQDGGDGFEMVSHVQQYHCHVSKGHVVLHLQLNVPSDLSNDESALGEYLTKTFGKLIKTADSNKPGFMDLAGLNGRMPIRRIVVDAYQRTPENKRITMGDFVMCDIDIYWGRDQ